MAEDQDKQLPHEAAKNAMPAGMVGFAIPVPVPVFTPQVMPMRMVAPFWPANGMSFMQQYMEVVNAGMAQTVNQSTSRQNESTGKIVPTRDAPQGLRKMTTPPELENVNMNQFMTEFRKGQVGDFPQVSDPFVFPLRGFLPFGTCFPGLNVPVSRLPSKDACRTESPAKDEALAKDPEGNDLVDKSKHESSHNVTEQNGPLEVKTDSGTPFIKVQETPSKSSVSNETDTEYSPEMDVAQILVNDMPVPVIGKAKQGANDASPKESNNAVSIPNKNTSNYESVSSVKTDLCSSKVVAGMMIKGILEPKKEASVKDPSSSCEPGVKDSALGQITDIEPIKSEKYVKEMPSPHCLNIQVPIGSAAKSKNATTKAVAQINNTVPSGVFILVNAPSTSQPQGSGINTATTCQSQRSYLVASSATQSLTNRLNTTTASQSQGSYLMSTTSSQSQGSNSITMTDSQSLGSYLINSKVSHPPESYLVHSPGSQSQGSHSSDTKYSQSHESFLITAKPSKLRGSFLGISTPSQSQGNRSSTVTTSQSQGGCLGTFTPCQSQGRYSKGGIASQLQDKNLCSEQQQAQSNHLHTVTFVKTECKYDDQRDNKTNNGFELMEVAIQSEEDQQGIVSDDENAVPAVDDLLKGDLGSDKSSYKCQVCAQLFRSSLGLQKHLEFHMDDGQHYTCTICFQPFTEAKSLEDHIAQHMRKRPHKCKFCPKAFRDPGSLQKHVRVHTGEKPYKCNRCEQSFAEYSSLRKHLRVHTGEQPYRCQYCDRAFSISGNLQRHVLIHTGERPYKCSFCPKAFNNPSHLRRHVKNLHFKGEATTGVVEDMISALNGEAKRLLPANEVEIETTEQDPEISKGEEENIPFTPRTA